MKAWRWARYKIYLAQRWVRWRIEGWIAFDRLEKLIWDHYTAFGEFPTEVVISGRDLWRIASSRAFALRISRKHQASLLRQMISPPGANEETFHVVVGGTRKAYVR